MDDRYTPCTMEVAAIVLSKMTTSKVLIKHGIIEGKCSLM
jgi:hypothetical protein